MSIPPQPRILVLGGRGFVGRHLVPKLQPINLFQPGEPFDLGDPSQVSRLIDDFEPEIVINLIGVMRGDHELMHRVHVRGTQNLVDSLRESKVKIIAAGSAAEYGPIDRMPVTETTAAKPVSDYGRTKLEATEMLLRESDKAIIFRPSNIIGPGMAQHLLLGSLIKQVKDGASQVRLSSLNAIRDYIDVRDVATAICALIGAPGGIYNVSQGVGRTNSEVLETLSHHVGTHLRARLDAPTPGSSTLDYFVADSSKLKEATGWTPEFDFDDSTRDTWGAKS